MKLSSLLDKWIKDVDDKEAFEFIVTLKSTKIGGVTAVKWEHDLVYLHNGFELHVTTEEMITCISRND